MSDGELKCRGDQFARSLAQYGVGSGGIVAICMERAFDWIVSALGIMRTGAAVVSELLVLQLVAARLLPAAEVAHILSSCSSR
jgi:non-ribosomal peptide synthetase component F